MRLQAVISLIGNVETIELTSWIDRGWVQPDPAGDDWDFHEIDVARVRLIHDLRWSMDVSEDAIPLVLSLLDQVYDLRDQLRRILGAVENQPPEVRAAVIKALGS